MQDTLVAEYLGNVALSSSISLKKKKILESILKKVQTDLHEHNPFVKDFLQIKDIGLSKIIIRANNQPAEHEHRYNQQLNFNEVSILNSKPHDLVLH